jgi:hypothetical protein
VDSVDKTGVWLNMPTYKAAHPIQTGATQQPAPTAPVKTPAHQQGQERIRSFVPVGNFLPNGEQLINTNPSRQAYTTDRSIVLLATKTQAGQ